MALPVRLGSARTSDVELLPYAQRGELWFAGTGVVNFTTAQYLRVLFSNPLGSGKIIYINLLRFFADRTAFVSVMLDPTTDLPVTSKLITGAILGVPYAGVTSFKSDIAAVPISGGVAASTCFALGSGSDSQIPGPFILNPGRTIGLNCSAGGLTTGFSNIRWIEIGNP